MKYPGRYSCLVSHPTQQQVTAQNMRRLVEQCHGLVNELGWRKNHDYTFGELIALCHAELSEALEGHRKQQADRHLPDRPAVEVELADVVIRICDMSGQMGFDLGGAIAEKLAVNVQRGANCDGKSY